MKILFFINTLSAGGKERRLTELIKELNGNGTINFELVVMSEDIHYKDLFDLDIKIHKLVRDKKKDVTMFKKIWRICKIYRPDIIHCWDSMTAFYLTPICKILKIKLINGMVVGCPTEQNVFNPHWLRARLTFPFSDCIVGNSKAGLKAYNAPEKKSYVIYNGFNFKRHNNMVPPEDIRKELDIKTRFIVGMVASFSTNKDYKTYFQAAEMVLSKRNDVTFLAIGNRTDSAQSSELINTNLNHNFRLLGIRSEIESLINAIDIGVLATFTEGISNSILEYMAAGKPVIATRGGGTSEIVVDSETGLLVDASRPTDLASKIEFLLNDPELRSKLGAQAKWRVESMFSIDRMVNEYVSLYQSVIMKSK